MDPRVEHVVVLMLENRSFDHMLGFLPQPGIGPVPSSWANPELPGDPASPVHAASWLGNYDDVSVDPAHGLPDVMRQLTGRVGAATGPFTNDGFVWNYKWRVAGAHDRDSGAAKVSEIMGCYPERLVPTLATLAREFAYCARWHCSLPSETWPNRLFAHAATSDGTVKNVIRLYTNETIFDRLTAAGATSRVYFRLAAQAFAFRATWKSARAMYHFYDDAKAGDLPAYSFIEPLHFTRWTDSQHPTRSVHRGERLIRSVYEALAASPQWDSTLLLITYDEHGGFPDRVAPPRATPMGASTSGFQFDLLGPRVPAVVVSPYIAKGTVDTAVREHATIVHTVREQFCPGPPLTQRDEEATNLLDLLALDVARVPPSLPDAPVEAEAELELDAAEAAAERIGLPDLNDLQRGLLALARLIDQEQGVDIRGSVFDLPYATGGEIEDYLKGFEDRMAQGLGMP